MSIAVKQIDQTQLAAFVNTTAAGAAFSGNFLDYVNNGGYLGTGVVAITGGTQTIYTDVTFALSPTVPYSGTTGEAVARKYIDDLNSDTIIGYSGFATGNYARTVFANTFTATNTFTQNVFLPKATNTGHATNLSDILNISGVLQSGINNVSVAGSMYVFGEQLITGKKIFAAGATVSAPSEPSGIVNLAYLTGNFTVSNAVATTGDQSVSGIKTFLQSPKGPIGAEPTSFVTKQQLDALGISMGGINGFAGVISVNAQSGASGHLFLQGAGNVTVSNCGGLFTFSGQESNSTKIYSNTFLMATGLTGFRINFSSGFGEMPAILSSIQTSDGPSSVIFDSIYNVNSSGFNVSFSNPIINTGTYYSFLAAPSLLSGYLALKGEQGIQGVAGQNGNSPNLRDVWQNGIVYNPLDIIYQEPNSYACKTFHFSDYSNAPSGAGTSYWQLFSSGLQRVSGSWDYRGEFSPLKQYGRTSAVYLSGSTYGYSGISPISGVYPADLTGGWHYIAKQGDIGPIGPSGEMGLAGTGIVSISFRGDYNSAETYYNNPDIVYYNGSSYGYSGVTPVTNVSPDLGLGWFLMAAAGEAGPSGVAGPAGPAAFPTLSRHACYSFNYDDPAAAVFMQDEFTITGVYIACDGANDQEPQTVFTIVTRDLDGNVTDGPTLYFNTGIKFQEFTSEFSTPLVIPAKYSIYGGTFTTNASLGYQRIGVMGWHYNSESSIPNPLPNTNTSHTFGWGNGMNESVFCQDNFYITGAFVACSDPNDQEPSGQFRLAIADTGGAITYGTTLSFETGLLFQEFLTEFSPPVLVSSKNRFFADIVQDAGNMGWNKRIAFMGWTQGTTPTSLISTGVVHKSYTSDFGDWIGAMQDDFYITGYHIYSTGTNDSLPDFEFRFTSVFFDGTSLSENDLGSSNLLYETGLFYKFQQIDPPILVEASKMLKTSVYQDNNVLGYRKLTTVGYTL